MTTKRRGGVAIDGGVALGEPSPDGVWSPTLDEDFVDFERDEFTRVLANKGDKVLWEKAAVCPNRGVVSPQDHKLGCDICGGGGFVFFGATTTEMLIVSATLKQIFMAQGRWDHGSVMITALPGTKLSYFDRITLVNRAVRYTEVLRRQPNGLYDRPKYDVQTIEYAAWVNRSRQLVSFPVSGTGAAIAPVVTGPQIGQVHWTSNSVRPDDNADYTISYTFQPKYRVLDLPHQHRASTITTQVPPTAPNGPDASEANNEYDFPVQAVGVLDFLVRDEGRDAAQNADQDPFSGR